MAMKKRDKKAWVKALRSGEYEQGRGALRCDDKFCCLGVAADLFYDGCWEFDGPTLCTDGWKNFWAIDDSIIAYRPPGLSDDDKQSLMAMNDAGRSFNQIADWIEENL